MSEEELIQGDPPELVVYSNDDLDKAVLVLKADMGNLKEALDIAKTSSEITKECQEIVKAFSPLVDALANFSGLFMEGVSSALNTHFSSPSWEALQKSVQALPFSQLIAINHETEIYFRKINRAEKRARRRARHDFLSRGKHGMKRPKGKRKA